ncbi:PKD domain-containing protein [Pleionea sp. CnH1-48]|uniref:PKD domain-containing protein n=1 Tax=Pleionea sp. CnH1-48 TaxID=2954494 RepID=UPI0020982E72|nr:PKD domain-containing protein [Pleionea sp. CnH1-48]MCO7226232.1 PKD domain-containing protein [Pleionea sp. CnH1-48]
MLKNGVTRLAVVILSTALIFGCSGGGSDEAPASEQPSDGNGNGDGNGSGSGSGDTNTAPVAAISVTDSVIINNVVNASGSGSSDADNDSLTYSWQLVAPDGSSASLSSNNQEDTSFTPDIAGNYELRLTVNDGTEDSNQVSRTVAAVAPATGQKVSFQSISGSEQTNVPVTFAYVFEKGTYQNNQQFAFQLEDESNIIAVQTDAKATYKDGSLRHAIFSGVIPQLGANTTLAGELIPVNTSPSATSAGLNDLLASNFDATIELNVNGVIYTASAKTMLQAQANAWLAGPVANEWYVNGSFKNGNSEHPHLAANFNIRVYGNLDNIWISAAVENNWAYQTSPQNFTYTATFSINNQVVHTENNLKHLRSTRWRKEFWTSAAPQLHIAHDAQYLIKTGAIPNYDPALIDNIAPAQLEYYATEWQDQNVDIAVTDDGYLVHMGTGGNEFTYNKIGPMGLGFANAKMPTTGARPDIGPLPRWAATYLLSQDRRAKTAALGMGNQAASWPIHYRDKNTGLPLSIVDYPYASSFWNVNMSNNPNTGLNEHTALCELGPEDCVVPYTADTAHQPSLAYVPYLVTGDHYYLEELHFWSTYNLLEMNPNYRSHDKGLFGVDMQDRAQAWSMRTLGQTAFITPDNHPMKNYFSTILTNNLDYYHELYVTAKPNSYGAMIPNYSHPTASPWMDDFFTWAIGSLVDLDYTEARPLLDWKAKFPVQRMGYGTQNNDSYCWIFASAYHVLIAPAQGEAMFNEIADVYTNTNGQEIPWGGGFDDAGTACASQAQGDALGLQAKEMIGYSSSPTGFPSNLQIALAAAVDSGIDGAEEAWQRFQSRSVKPDYTAYPNYAIVPRR